MQLKNLWLSMLKKWFDEYRSSLKLIEVEELFDLIFYRPLAFLFVKSIYRTNLTPNQITFGAIGVSLLGGIIFSFGTYTASIAGALLFMAYNIFDCADGQLARLKKNGTSLGRIIDGFADYIAGIALYFSIGFAFANDYYTPPLFWLLTFTAGMSVIFLSITLDYYRNRYLDYALNRKPTLSEDLKEHRDAYKEISNLPGRKFDKLLYKIYFSYSKIQIRFSSGISNSGQKTYDRNDFISKNKTIMRFWTFIGQTTQWTFFFVSVFFNRIDIYLWGLVICFNIAALTLYLIQKIINSKTLQSPKT